MKAVIMNRYGGSENLELAEVPRPKAQRGQCLVQVSAAGVNPIDWKIRNGMFRFLIWLKFPHTLGFDLSGEVVEVGPGVTRFHVGDKVYGLTDVRRGGAYSEFAVVREKMLAPLPESLTLPEAAGLPIAGLTALWGIQQAAVQSGQKVLVVGGAGGVGHLAVQVCKSLGAHVSTSCSSKNVDWVRGLGADQVLDYQKVPVLETGPYDVIYDTVAKYSFSQCAPALGPAGRYLSTIPHPALFLKQLMLPSYSRKRARYAGMRAGVQEFSRLNELVESGQLKVRVETLLPLSAAKSAHDLSESGRARGKIVLQVSE